MKNSIIIIFAMIATFSFTACVSGSDIAMDDNITEKTESAAVGIQQSDADIQEQSEADFGAKGALVGQDFTLEEMLEYAIQDEYLARQEYESIMEEYGEQKPFSNIIKAEETHIGLLKELYVAYEIAIPEDTAIDHVIVPDSLDIAYDVGVQAEIDNIAMYELFLEQSLPDEVRDVFIELRDASENHLAAFEKGPRGQGNN